MSRALRILVLEPFDGGSHRAFARGWRAASRHEIEVASLPARFWKWRLRGAGLTFAERYRGRLDGFDAIVATSLMNAADFRAAARPRAPLVVYFHENQLSYPRPPGEPLDHGLALASLASAAAADRLVFNSRFHRDAFARGLEAWTARFPDFPPAATARAAIRRSTVIPPGIDWRDLARRALRKTTPEMRGRSSSSPGSGRPPLILWNHRWEFDKNPETFFGALGDLEARGRGFRLAILGRNEQFVPKPFLAARGRFAGRIDRFGFVPGLGAYRGWLGRSDIIVSTARQENFGIAVAEAIAAGAFPLLPDRLSYPEILPARDHAACLYRSRAELVAKLDRLLAHPERLGARRRERSAAMRRYDWPVVAPKLDAVVEREVDRAAERGRR